MAILTSIVVLTIVAASSGGLGAPAGDPGDEIWDRTFRSTAVTENGQPRALAPGTRIRLALTKGRMTAYAGCGEIVADAAVSGTRLVVSRMDVWRNGCVDDQRLNQDLWLAAFLNRDPPLLLDGHDLVLRDGGTGPGAGTEIRFTDATSVAKDPPLLETYWVIESVVRDGKVIDLPDYPQPYLILRGTGDLEGFNTCNWMSGSVEVRDSAIVITGLGSTKRACPDADLTLEIAVMDALANGEVTYRIANGRLELTRTGGPDLLLRSDS